MSIRISQVEKLDGIKSWSLLAGDDCPGRINLITKEIAEVCQGCYALGGNYRFPNVKAPRIENGTDWERDEWEDEMVTRLQGEEYFRWFDSGDMKTARLGWKMLNVMRRTPHTRHWVATRMGKFPKFQPIIAAMMSLPNVMVRFSSDDLNTYEVGTHSCVVLTEGVELQGVTVCSAYKKDEDKVAKCHGCRACWDKDIKVIGYKAHGKKMRKVIKLVEERT